MAKWFAGMIKYFYKMQLKHMSKLGLNGTIYLMIYPNKEIDPDTGLTVTGEPTIKSIMGIMVSFPYSQSLGGIFGEILNREFQGEYETGDSVLVCDAYWLTSNSIVIDTRLDRIKYNNEQYKIVKKADYVNYFNLEFYLLRKTAETYEE